MQQYPNNERTNALDGDGAPLDPAPAMGAAHPPTVDDEVAVHRHVPDHPDDDAPHHVSGHRIDNEHSFHLVDDKDPEVLAEIAEHHHHS